MDMQDNCVIHYLSDSQHPENPELFISELPKDLVYILTTDCQNAYQKTDKYESRAIGDIVVTTK